MASAIEALAIAQKGFYVFPVQAGGKLPAIAAFPKRASNQPQEVEKFWAPDPVLHFPRDYNVGISTSRFADDYALLVVDIDNKDGRNGFETILNLEAVGYELPETLTQATPSSGEHRIYWVEASVKQGTNILGAGVDIRSQGGYIVGPGSVINGNAYQFINDIPIAKAPSWLIERCGKPNLREGVMGHVDVSHIDQTRAMERAKEYLSKMPPATKGGRNDQGFKAAARLKDMGLNPQNMFEVMTDRWKCEPQLDLEELKAIVDSVYEYGLNRPGCDSPEEAFDEVPIEPSEERVSEDNLIKLISFNAVAFDPDEPMLVEDFLDQEVLALLVSEPNLGKSFAGLEIAHCVASGRDFLGKKVSQGPVVYVVAEGQRRFKKRIAALKKVYGSEPNLPLHFVFRQIDLTNVESLKALFQEIKKSYPNLALLVIDTLAQTFGRGDENSSAEMQTYIDALSGLKRELKCTVLTLHHPTKSNPRNARGHGKLFGSLDAQITLTKIEKSKILVLSSDKQRDEPKEKKMTFKLRTIELGRDKTGRAVTTCYVAYVDPDAAKAFTESEKEPTGYAATILRILKTMSIEVGIEPPAHLKLPFGTKVVLRKELKKRFLAQLEAPKPGDEIRRDTFDKPFKALISSNRIGKEDDCIWFKEVEKSDLSESLK